MKHLNKTFSLTTTKKKKIIAFSVFTGVKLRGGQLLHYNVTYDVLNKKYCSTEKN